MRRRRPVPCCPEQRNNFWELAVIRKTTHRTKFCGCALLFHQTNTHRQQRVQMGSQQADRLSAPSAGRLRSTFPQQSTSLSTNGNLRADTPFFSDVSCHFGNLESNNFLVIWVVIRAVKENGIMQQQRGYRTTILLDTCAGTAGGGCHPLTRPRSSSFES